VRFHRGSTRVALGLHSKLADGVALYHLSDSFGVSLIYPKRGRQLTRLKGRPGGVGGRLRARENRM